MNTTSQHHPKRTPRGNNKQQQARPPPPPPPPHPQRTYITYPPLRELQNIAIAQHTTPLSRSLPEEIKDELQLQWWAMVDDAFEIFERGLVGKCSVCGMGFEFEGEELERRMGMLKEEMEGWDVENIGEEEVERWQREFWGMEILMLGMGVECECIFMERGEVGGDDGRQEIEETVEHEALIEDKTMEVDFEVTNPVEDDQNLDGNEEVMPTSILSNFKELLEEVERREKEEAEAEARVAEEEDERKKIEETGKRSGRKLKLKLALNRN